MTERRKETVMKYITPQVKAAGKASQLIQAKVQPGTDNGNIHSRLQMASVLEN